MTRASHCRGHKKPFWQYWSLGRSSARSVIYLCRNELVELVLQGWQNLGPGRQSNAAESAAMCDCQPGSQTLTVPLHRPNLVCYPSQVLCSQAAVLQASGIARQERLMLHQPFILVSTLLPPDYYTLPVAVCKHSQLTALQVAY